MASTLLLRTLSFNDYGLHNNKMFINKGVHNVKIS